MNFKKLKYLFQFAGCCVSFILEDLQFIPSWPGKLIFTKRKLKIRKLLKSFQNLKRNTVVMRINSVNPIKSTNFMLENFVVVSIDGKALL